jgi:hypothetical protein
MLFMFHLILVYASYILLDLVCTLYLYYWFQYLSHPDTYNSGYLGMDNGMSITRPECNYSNTLLVILLNV